MLLPEAGLVQLQAKMETLGSDATGAGETCCSDPVVPALAAGHPSQLLPFLGTSLWATQFSWAYADPPVSCSLPDLASCWHGLPGLAAP